MATTHLAPGAPTRRLIVGRYQSHTLLREEGAVRTFLGIDQLTGLPVLIYRFAGKPTAAAGDLTSDNIPGILASSLQGHQGELVVAYLHDYQPVTPPMKGDALQLLLLDSARALRDAAKASVVHGDLKPERFLGAGEHHLVEGYGVRWQASSGAFSPPEGESSFAGDVFAWAASALFLADGNLPETLQPLLQACLTKDSQARPVAKDIYREIKNYVYHHKSSSNARPLSPFDTLEIEFNADPQSWPELTPSPLPPPAAEVESEPLLVHTNPRQHANTPPTGARGLEVTGLLVPKAPQTSHAGFVKDLPPGATYRSGQSGGPPPAPPTFKAPIAAEERRPGSRRFFLLLLVILGAAVLAYLALWYQGRTSPPTSAAVNPKSFFVDVQVVPDDLGRVALLVVESPQGSARHPNDELSPVPGEVALDHQGTWELRGKFGNRLSDVVIVQVPEQKTVTLHFPETQSPLLPSK